MKNILWLLPFLFLLNSCNQYRRFTYLQVPDNKKDTIYAKKLSAYKLQPADNLYINVSSPINKTTDEMFNNEILGSTSYMSGIQGGSLYLIGYVIDADGFINLPVLGKIHVSGITVDEVKVKLQELVSKVSSDGRVEVKLLSFKISVLGEINRPGQYTIFSDRATILEALAMAGDISYNGNRRKVLILRSYENGTEPVSVDLTKRTVLDSDKYFLRPNDIIYVEPYKSAAFRIRLAEYSQYLTLITSTITAVLLINNVIK